MTSSCQPARCRPAVASVPTTGTRPIPEIEEPHHSEATRRTTNSTTGHSGSRWGRAQRIRWQQQTPADDAIAENCSVPGLRVDRIPASPPRTTRTLEESQSTGLSCGACDCYGSWASASSSLISRRRTIRRTPISSRSEGRQEQRRCLTAY